MTLDQIICHLSIFARDTVPQHMLPFQTIVFITEHSQHTLKGTPLRYGRVTQLKGKTSKT